MPRECVVINKSNTNLKKYILPSFLLSNVCHITNKMVELFAVVSTNNPTVTLITESSVHGKCLRYTEDLDVVFTKENSSLTLERGR